VLGFRLSRSADWRWNFASARLSEPPTVAARVLFRPAPLAASRSRRCESKRVPMSEWPNGALHLAANQSDPARPDVRMVPDFTQPPQIGFEGYGGGIDFGDGPTPAEPPDRTAEERLADHLASIPPPDPPGTSRWPDGRLARNLGRGPLFAGVSMPDDVPPSIRDDFRPSKRPLRRAVSRRPNCSRPRGRRSRVTRKQRTLRRAGSSRGDPGDPDPDPSSCAPTLRSAGWWT
jgi:hypothetical protein